MGLINGRNVDAKFVVQPGGGSDARFEFWWARGGNGHITAANGLQEPP